MIVDATAENRTIAMAETEINSARSIEAEVRMGIGRASLVRAHWRAPIDSFGQTRDHYLQLSMFADDGRACYPEVWGPFRFEPVGSMFFTPARQVIHAKSNCVLQQAVVCNFGVEALEAWFEERFDWTSGRLASGLDLANTEVRQLLLRMGAELRSPGFATETMVELLAGQVAIELSRHLCDVEVQTVSGGLAPWRLRLIDDFLRENADRATLSELAKECRLSVRQLSRGFRVSRDRSIGAYIAECKIERACTLLAAGHPIKAVASDLGFSSAANFSAAFLRATGERPRNFRARI